MSRGRDVDMSLPLPAVLLGVHTGSKLRYEVEEKEDQIFRKHAPQTKNQRNWLPPAATIEKSSHIEDKNALHMVIENLEPMGMVRSVRSYFLTSNAPKMPKFNEVENFAGYVDNYELAHEKDSLFLDEYKLTSCYLKMV